MNRQLTQQMKEQSGKVASGGEPKWERSGGVADSMLERSERRGPAVARAFAVEEKWHKTGVVTA